MSFRKLAGVPLPEKKQGLIYYTCLTANDQPYYTQQKIIKLCDSVGGENSRALWELLTSGRSIPSVATEFFLSIETLTRLRREFYKQF